MSPLHERPFVYELTAIREALHASLDLDPEEEIRVADAIVVALHAQHYRLISDGASFDD